ncbi:MAG: DUF4013 domain-containing protein [Anaerolineales bacterium]
MLDIRRALEYLTEDEKAQTKIAVGALMAIIPLANVAAAGYEVEVTRRVARNEPRPLPEWNDIGGLFVTGAWLSLARLVYMLPIFLVMFAGMAAWFVFILQAAQSSREASPALGPAILITFFCTIAGVFVYGLLLGFVFPAILAVYARRGTFAACFDFAAISRFIRRDPGQYALAWLAELGLGLAIGLISAVVGLVLGAIPCLGTIALYFVFGLAGFILLMFNGHLVGQLMQADAKAVIAKES